MLAFPFRPTRVCYSVHFGCETQRMGFPFQHHLAVQAGFCLWFPAPLPWHVHRCWCARHSKCQTDKSCCRGQLLLSLLQVFLYMGFPGVFVGISCIYDRCDWNGAFRAVPEVARSALVTLLLTEGPLLTCPTHRPMVPTQLCCSWSSREGAAFGTGRGGPGSHCSVNPALALPATRLQPPALEVGSWLRPPAALPQIHDGIYKR